MDTIEVDKKLLNVIHAKLHGFIDSYGLHPDVCGYRSETWEVYEKLSKILGRE